MKPILKSRKKIKNINGDIVKFIDKRDKNFRGFGEIYFSFINKNKIKAWKFNKTIHSNFIVPYGKVLVVVFDKEKNYIQKDILSYRNLNSLYLPPNFFYGFMGLEEKSLIVNLINKNHNVEANNSIPKNFLDFDWGKFKI